MSSTRENFIYMCRGKKIICFGAGNFLKAVKGFLESENLKISYLIDSNPAKWGCNIENMRVESPEILYQCSGEDYLILISAKNYKDDIEKNIKEKFKNKFEIFKWPLSITEIRAFDEKIWYERIYKPCEDLYMSASLAIEKDKREYYLAQKRQLLRNREKVILPRIPIMITTRCTLCCEECSNLMPYYRQPQDYEVDEIITWIQNLCFATDEVICLELVGGEPFLYRDLEKILEYVLAESKIQQVEITSNASIIPNSTVIKNLKNPKIIVKVSQYPNVIDSSKFIGMLDENNINYRVLENMKWTKTGELVSRGRTILDLQSQYLNCASAKTCRTVLNGKMYVCSKAASLMELGIVNNLEFVNLKDKDNLRENIKKFMELPFSKACDYCDIASKEEQIIDPAIQKKLKGRS